MGSAVHDVLDESSGAGPGLLTPADEARGAPLEMGLVGFGPVPGIGGKATLAEATQVYGHTTAVMENLHAGACDSDFDSATDELVGHAVEVAQHVDVVIDVGPAVAPLGDLEGSRGERP